MRSPVGRTDPAGDPNRDFYLHLGMIHGSHGMIMGTIRAADIEDSELTNGISTPDGNDYTITKCEGSTTVGSTDAIRCTFRGSKGRVLQGYMRATATPYGHPGLLIHLSTDQRAARFALPGSRSMAVGSATAEQTDPADVTPDVAQFLVGQAILTQHDHEWDGSPDPKSTCAVRDGGRHLVCDVSGTPQRGKGDGRWYGTLQQGSDDRVQYLFTKLPSA